MIGNSFMSVGEIVHARDEHVRFGEEITSEPPSRKRVGVCVNRDAIATRLNGVVGVEQHGIAARGVHFELHARPGVVELRDVREDQPRVVGDGQFEMLSQT